MTGLGIGAVALAEHYKWKKIGDDVYKSTMNATPRIINFNKVKPNYPKVRKELAELEKKYNIK